MKALASTFFLAALISSAGGLGSGCARRMTVATGTTIGLNATPGDGQSQSPQITFAYKRAEVALVPTAGQSASNSPDSDAYSALAIIDFRTKWFSGTAIDQFIATGLASRDIQGKGSEFTQALAKGGGVRNDVVEATIYQALSAAARTGDAEAALCVRDLDALGELEPDEYTYITIPPHPPAAPTRAFARRNAQPSYATFTAYRGRLKGSINVLKSAPTVSVTEIDNTVRALAGDDLKHELNKYEQALGSLQQRVAARGATHRALTCYVETLKR